jgi:peroxiredoxin
MRLAQTLMAALLLGAVGCDTGYSDTAAESESASPATRVRVPAVGSPAPDFELRDLSGRLVRLSAHQGRVVLLNFWATWCGPCKDEMPSMERLYHEFDPKQFEILAVSMDAQGPSITRPFIESFALTFPVLHDTDLRVAAQYGARAIPATFVLNREGVIVWRFFGGPLNWQSPEQHAVIQKLIEQRPPGPPAGQTAARHD